MDNARYASRRNCVQIFSTHVKSRHATVFVPRVCCQDRGRQILRTSGQSSQLVSAKLSKRHDLNKRVKTDNR